MSVSVIVELEYLVDDKAYHKRQYKEKQYLSRNEESIAVGVLEAENKGEDDNADNVVYDSGTEYGLSNSAVELAHFLEHLNGYAN